MLTLTLLLILLLTVLPVAKQTKSAPDNGALFGVYLFVFL